MFVFKAYTRGKLFLILSDIDIWDLENKWPVHVPTHCIVLTKRSHPYDLSPPTFFRFLVSFLSFSLEKSSIPNNRSASCKISVWLIETTAACKLRRKMCVGRLWQISCTVRGYLNGTDGQAAKRDRHFFFYYTSWSKLSNSTLHWRQNWFARISGQLWAPSPPPPFGPSPTLSAVQILTDFWMAKLYGNRGMMTRPPAHNGS